MPVRKCTRASRTQACKAEAKARAGAGVGTVAFCFFLTFWAFSLMGVAGCFFTFRAFFVLHISGFSFFTFRSFLSHFGPFLDAIVNVFQLVGFCGIWPFVVFCHILVFVLTLRAFLFFYFGIWNGAGTNGNLSLLHVGVVSHFGPFSLFLVAHALLARA